MAHRQTQCDFAALRRRVQSAFVFVREEVEVGLGLGEDVRAEEVVVAPRNARLAVATALGAGVVLARHVQPRRHDLDITDSNCDSASDSSMNANLGELARSRRVAHRYLH